MATVNVVIGKTVVSGAAQVNGEPVRANGGKITVQIVAPAALGRIEQSNDGANWVVAREVTTDSTTLASGIYSLEDLTEWVRPATLTDASQPRIFEFVFSIQKES